MNILPSWITGFWYDVYDEHKSVWATFKTKGTACIKCIQHYFWVIDRVTENRRLETIVMTQTNATKAHLQEGRMLRHYSSSLSACERQSRQKDVTNTPPASDSTSDRFWRQQTVLALLSLLSKSPCNGYSETKPYWPREGRRLVTLGLRKARFLQNTLVN